MGTSKDTPPGARLADGSNLRDECAAIGAEWIQLAAELDARAAAWKARASTWTRNEPRDRGAAARVEWAVERTRGLAAWWRQLAKDLMHLT